MITKYVVYYRSGEENSAESYVEKSNAIDRAEFLVEKGIYDIYVKEERIIFKYYAEENICGG